MTLKTAGTVFVRKGSIVYKDKVYDATCIDFEHVRSTCNEIDYRGGYMVKPLWHEPVQLPFRSLAELDKLASFALSIDRAMSKELVATCKVIIEEYCPGKKRIDRGCIYLETSAIKYSAERPMKKVLNELIVLMLDQIFKYDTRGVSIKFAI